MGLSNVNNGESGIGIEARAVSDASLDHERAIHEESEHEQAQGLRSPRASTSVFSAA